MLQGAKRSRSPAVRVLVSASLRSAQSQELALYEKYYSEVINAAQMIVEGYSTSDCCKLLQLYFDSKMMTRKDIFNKYKLNEKIYTYAHEHNNTLWEIISESLEGNQSEWDSKIIRIIVDGVFEKLCNEQINPDDVIERLVRLL